MSILQTIKQRRSVRKFLKGHVEDNLLTQILEAARWAPSGLNNQPWRFIIVRDVALKEKLASLTVDGSIIRGADLLIAVFLDNAAVYSRQKDLQAMGACIQNMLLVTCDLGLGGCWLGEILNKRAKVQQLLNSPSSYELMAVVAIGYPASKPTSKRKALARLVYKEYK